MLSAPIAKTVPMFLFGPLSMQDSFGNSHGIKSGPDTSFLFSEISEHSRSVKLWGLLLSYRESKLLRTSVSN